MKLPSLLGLAICLGLVAVGQAQDGDAPLLPGENLIADGIPPIPAEIVESVARYTEFRGAGLASWHPTRREMLIGTRFADVGQVHRVLFPGGARTQLTFFPDGAGGAAFQPTHGNYFVFNKDKGGNEFYQKYRYDLASGEITLLTDGKSRNTGLRWNEAGDRVAYSSTRRNGRDTDIYVMDPAEPKTEHLLLQVPSGGWGAIDWSPDGKTLTVGEYLSVNESYIWLVDVATGEKRCLTDRNSKEQIAYGGAQFSKDGKGIYTATDKGSEFHRLAYVDLATGEHKFLTDHIPWDVDSFERSFDGKYLAFITNEAGVGKLHVVELATMVPVKLPELPVGRITGMEWHKNSRDLGFGMTSARSPSDVYSIDVTTGILERWTTSETGGINTAGFSESQLIKWTSFDGREISGFLYPPAQKFTGRRPVVINIHGGPESQARPGFLGRNNYFLNEMGVALIFPNIRGSSGYGKTFLKLDNGLQREDSYKDIAALLDWIATQPNLDPDRVMVTGASYGGHMSFAIATYYADRIRASLPVVGISHLRTFLERTESYRRDLRRAEYGDERDPKMLEFMERTAPLNNAKKITKPIFIVQGANDPRVPLNEAEQMRDIIKQNGGTVWTLIAKDEGHGFAKKKNADYQFYATVMFMRQYLLQ